LDLLKQGGDAHLSSLLLLTDGRPNIEPPRGHLPMLKRYKEQNPFPFTLNTFGFGYNLNSPLLSQLAVEGNGSYAFIPDSNFVGTCFGRVFGVFDVGCGCGLWVFGCWLCFGLQDSEPLSQCTAWPPRWSPTSRTSS
jgi:hypothetical protein